MSAYFDTSFLAPLIRHEASSREVARLLGAQPSPASSHWMRAELTSMLARDVRMGIITSDQAVNAESRFGSIIAQGFQLWAPSVQDFEDARTFMQSYETGLRAGDALHLAIAKNNGATNVYSLDKKLIAAGHILGLPVSSGDVHAV